MVQVGGGRRLSVEVTGDPDGRPVFLLHGTPGSRLGPRPRGSLLHRLGIRLISFDRPGYGRSDRLPGRRVADVAEDVAAIADIYQLERFAIAGRSGGGPHALACAALLPRRTTRAAVLVSLAPPQADGLDWFEGMTKSNIIDFTAAGAGQNPLAERLKAAAEEVRADPASLLAGLEAGLTADDRRVVADTGIRAMLQRTYAEALRVSAYGWIDDALALCTPWGFELSDVTVPVLFWHGEQDAFSPVGHTRWMAERIPGATIVVESEAAHFGALDVLPDVLRWLAADVPPG